MTKLVVFHRYYGCDTGCCGHSVAEVPDDFAPTDRWDAWDYEKYDKFTFAHPDGWPSTEEQQKDFARKLIVQQYDEEHVSDLDWEHCIIEDD